jgi:hypothetical protein
MHENPSINTANTNARHWTRNWANSINHSTSQPISVRSIVNMISHPLFQVDISQEYFSHNKSVGKPCLPPNPSHMPSLLDSYFIILTILGGL